MRKLDNYSTFFVSGLGISGAASLATLALTLDVLFSLRIFILFFAISVAVAVVLIVFHQDEIREIEQDLRKNNIVRDRLDLIEKSQRLKVAYTSNFNRLEKLTGEAMGSAYTGLPDAPTVGS